MLCKLSTTSLVSSQTPPTCDLWFKTLRETLAKTYLMRIYNDLQFYHLMPIGKHDKDCRPLGPLVYIKLTFTTSEHCRPWPCHLRARQTDSHRWAVQGNRVCDTTCSSDQNSSEVGCHSVKWLIDQGSHSKPQNGPSDTFSEFAGCSSDSKIYIIV